MTYTLTVTTICTYDGGYLRPCMMCPSGRTRVPNATVLCTEVTIDTAASPLATCTSVTTRVYDIITNAWDYVGF